MKHIIYIGLLGLTLTACSTGSTTEVAEKEKQEQNNPTNVIANQVLTLEVEGMVCEMGCGGAIRKELYSSGGVSECDFDFEEDRETYTAKVYFDESVVSSGEILKIISKINDSQFTVKQIDLNPFEHPATETSHNDSDDDESVVQVESSTGFQFPNLLEIISGLLAN